jgi:hypothetical protein
MTNPTITLESSGNPVQKQDYLFMHPLTLVPIKKSWTNCERAERKRERQQAGSNNKSH